MGTMFYRCEYCRSVVAPWDIPGGRGCPKCGGLRVRPTSLSLFEKFFVLLRRPAFWRWEK